MSRAAISDIDVTEEVVPEEFSVISADDDLGSETEIAEPDEAALITVALEDDITETNDEGEVA